MGLRNMLLHHTKKDDGQEGDLISELYSHPLIRGATKPRLIRSGLRLPSYLSPRSFSLALLDTLAPPPASDEERRDLLDALEQGAQDYELPVSVQRLLLRQVQDARGQIDATRAELEEWFDDTMARVSGWYKRQAQLILIALAVIATAGLNVNTLSIAETLWKDPVVRAAVVAQATKGNQTTQGASAQDKLKNAADDVDGVKKLGVPLGWAASNSKDDPRHVGFDARTAGGWLLTMIALSLGAPFWFDALSRLSRLRATGKPEPPLPASGSGKPGERVGTQTASAVRRT
jgi:hypothetical protein